ncbi:uncharacterized protein palb2 [Electrophorus electricus]|uniref:uncharacterized protein palb2 n=1 Tax=Electrophorus electricus TaxID=8005 RepID=UPI0015CFE5D5|nr:uncharacterized protein palb2 [Electrophorus electricus]
MSEKSLMGEDKEMLRRRLALLQREYERTARRLQRAERREAVRRHVQNRISGHNVSGGSEPSPAPSTVSESDLLSNQTLLSETTKKIPQVQFLLSEGVGGSPCPSPTGHLSPTLRLRSRRSRLRLQTKERESDTDNSQGRPREGAGHGEGVKERHENDGVLGHDERSAQVGEQAEGQESSLETKCVDEKENGGDATGQREEAKTRNGWKEDGGNGKTSDEMPRSVLRDVLRGSESNSAMVLQKSAEEQTTLQEASEEFSVNQSAAEIFPNDQSETKISPTVQLADSSSWSFSSVPDQLMQTQSDQSTGVSNQPDEGLTQSNHLQTVIEETVGVADDDDCEGSVTIPCSSGKARFLDSCTLIDGLPFPVEYYIRTTRRMATAHSSIDLDAVIHSQLTRGRGRRRSGLPRTRRGGHATSEASQPSGKPLNQPRNRGRGRRRQRGCRRTRAVGTTRSPTGLCVAVHSQVEPSTQCHSLQELDSATQSECLLQSQSSLLVEPLPRARLTPQSAAASSPRPSSSTEQAVAEDFKHLSDSQLYLDCKSVENSEVYPVFRRRCGQAERAVLRSQSAASTNDCTPLLPSLASLAQALKKKDVRNLGHLLTAFDLQDFHLPDDVFGQLKLERLRLSCVSMEPPVSHHTELDAGRGNSCPGITRYDLRSRINGNHLEVRPLERECFVSEPLPPSASFEGTFPLSQNTDQSEKLTEPMNQLHSKTVGQTVSTKHEGHDKGPEDYVQLSDTHQLHECAANRHQSQTSATDLPDLKTPDAADTQTPVNNKSEVLGQGAGQKTDEAPMFQTVQNVCRPNETRELSDERFLSLVMPTLSFPLTTHSQRGPDSSLPSVGVTPHASSPSSHPVVVPLLSSPSSQSIAWCPSQPVVREPVPVAAPWMVAVESRTPRDTRVAGQTMVQGRIPAKAGRGRQEEGTRLEPEPVECVELVADVRRRPGTGRQAQDASEICDKHDHTEDTFMMDTLPQDIDQSENSFLNISEHEICPQIMSEAPPLTEPQTGVQMHSKALSPPCSLAIDIESGSNTKLSITSEPVFSCGLANQRADGAGLAPKRSEITQTDAKRSLEPMKNPAHLAKAAAQKQLTETTCHNALSCGSLEKTHTFKALETGCVLDVCLVRWPSEMWCVCVAGEWSVCVWAQKVRIQQWDLLHTWTFAQSVISLQEVPDSAGLLCVSLGKLDITEARILCCPSMNVQFSQVDLYKGALQAVLAVSDCRLVCCSVPGAHQKATVFTLAQDGRVADTLPLVSTNQSIQSLAAVEGEKDALIGWTDSKTLLIWNMKSGQLLQTIRLGESLSTTTCLRGYSYRGALCVLLQSASACCRSDGSAPFMLVATNPLTGKHLPLSPISCPATPSARLLDGDVCESNLVGVFQSGHLAVWDLRGGVASVFEDGVAELCRLARWAGPNILLTGCLSGDINLYQYKPPETRARCP